VLGAPRAEFRATGTGPCAPDLTVRGSAGGPVSGGYTVADTTTRRDEPHDFAPDLLGVKSRVSWSAIIAGTVVAFACYLVLTLLFGAIGITLTESGVRGNTVGWSILVAMIIGLMLSLFVGGWVASQMTAGENRQEAVIYGLLTWGAFTAVSLFTVAMGVKAGYFAAVGGSMVVQNSDRAVSLEEGMRQAGMPDKAINDAKAAMDPARAREMLNNPENQEKARQAAIAASWTALVATMLAMCAAIGGALVGAGPGFRLFPAAVVRREPGTRIIVPT
jgi:hypothetical protein